MGGHNAKCDTTSNSLLIENYLRRDPLQYQYQLLKQLLIKKGMNIKSSDHLTGLLMLLSKKYPKHQKDFEKFSKKYEELRINTKKPKAHIQKTIRLLKEIKAFLVTLLF